jgi:hypothetical protein
VDKRVVIITALQAIDKLRAEDEKITAAMNAVFEDFQGFSYISSVAVAGLTSTIASMFDREEEVSDWVDWYLYEMPLHDYEEEFDPEPNVIVDGVEYFIDSHSTFADYLVDVFE